tara:strand:+ start:106 stop:876 length:771 start_codon:yes stop_codon:yes gene_type:complete
MKILISGILIFSLIGLILPNAFAENTVQINSLKDSYNFDNDILLSGHVNFENGKAIGLGLGMGYPATLHVYDKTNNRLLHTDSQKLDNDNSFSFLIEHGKFNEKGIYEISIFYGPPKENFRNTSFAGSADLFVGISASEYKKQMEEKQRQLEEQQRQDALAASQKTSSNRFNQDDNSWMLAVMLIFLIFVVIVAAKRGAFNRGPYGSYDTPVSVKQLRRLRNSGYDGPMPQSSREAHWRIRDLLRGGDGTDIPDRD